MQCMATAATAGAAVTGVRSWLATRGFSCLTPRRLKRITVCLIAAGLIVSSLIFSGSQPPS